MKALGSGLRGLLGERRMLYQLMRNDLKARYAGSAFGMAWAFVQPLVSMLVMWAVFQVGFRTSPVDDIEFILWYIAANVPWIYYSDGVNSSAGCLYEYNYLVKKMRFRTELLPLVKVLSATCIHAFFMAFAVFMLEIYGYQPQLIWLQIIYYSFAAFCLILGLSALVSAVSVFFKDFAHMTGIVLGIRRLHAQPHVLHHERLSRQPDLRRAVLAQAVADALFLGGDAGPAGGGPAGVPAAQAPLRGSDLTGKEPKRCSLKTRSRYAA